MKVKTNKKVLVAMSGGVDSSVTTALLQKAGFEVVGVFMKFFDSSKGIQAEKKAEQVAKKLKLPFCVLDLRKEFNKAVIGYFLMEYKQGKTPNPCVVCNKEIKFKFLLKKALELKADFIATGHYVRKKESRIKNQELRILKAKDKNKDQSYFLWRLTQKQLKKTLFPIGDYTKQEVRILAKKFNLPITKTKESQEVCFIETATADFLKKHLRQKPGPIRALASNGAGEIVGRHQGLWFYTVGQRKGIGLSGGPYYVSEKNLKTNTLIVTRNKKGLKRKELFAKNINWISGKEPKLPYKVMAKIRYNSPLCSAVLNKKNTSQNL